MTNTYSASLSMEHHRQMPTFRIPALRFGHRPAQNNSYEEVVSLQERHPILSVVTLLLTGPAAVLAVAGVTAAVVTPVAWLCGWL